MKAKHLLTGVAVVAALAFSAPVWAQAPGGNAMGLPGPNPGGPGLTPYSSGAPSAVPPAAGAPTSEALPHHRHAHHHHLARAHHHHVTSTHAMLHAHGPRSGSDTTAQLNQAELARVQSGGAPAMAPASGPPPAYPPQSPATMYPQSPYGSSAPYKPQ
jgi:hypothetical protein